MIKRAIKNFFELESSTTILLFVATLTSIIIANSQNSKVFHDFINLSLPLSIETLGIYKNLTLKDWVNDALMAVFFFLIGLELKRETMIGELSSLKKISLPAVAAIGGVVMPAMIFFLINFDHPENYKAFAIPCATDIAFAYGIISFFKNKIPYSLKVFIVSLAVIDDLIAILIIAFFYTAKIDFFYIFFSAICLILLLILNQRRCGYFSLYLIVGILLWLFVLKSGIHATLAGILFGLFLPLRVKGKDFLEEIAHKFSGIVNFLILPIFALTNSAIQLNNFSIKSLAKPLNLGIICGLFFGKQIGIMLFSFVAIKLKIASMPTHLFKKVSWSQFYSVSIFTAIGFTMSIFIAELSFIQNRESDNLLLDEVKTSILIASIISIIFGVLSVSILNKNKKI
jgi:NhaA family Na+:H+ antiporter